MCKIWYYAFLLVTMATGMTRETLVHAVGFTNNLTSINFLSAKLFNLNLHSLEVVDRVSETQLK